MIPYRVMICLRAFCLFLLDSIPVFQNSIAQFSEKEEGGKVHSYISCLGETQKRFIYGGMSS